MMIRTYVLLVPSHPPDLSSPIWLTSSWQLGLLAMDAVSSLQMAHIDTAHQNHIHSWMSTFGTSIELVFDCRLSKGWAR
jgi:hypothetical protein